MKIDEIIAWLRAIEEQRYCDEVQIGSEVRNVAEIAYDAAEALERFEQ